MSSNLTVVPSDVEASPAEKQKGRSTTYDIAKIRADFPILSRSARSKPLVYLDNAATTQKPQAVIDRIVRYYAQENSNVHRGVHYLSELATIEFENARGTVQRFINAGDIKEVVFTRGTTESINLVAQTWGRANIGEGDEIVITAIEHHSNIVPWQMLCAEKGAKLRVAPVNDLGEVLIDELERMLSPRVKLVAVNHASNALGTINPVKRITAAAHAHGALVLIDGAQGVPHIGVDVQDLGCDFYAFSSHKVYGPTGVGVLYGRQSILDAMPPWQGGGDMILSVSYEKTTYNALPYKFEAGTPNIAGVVGFGAAVDFLRRYDLAEVAAHEHDLLEYGTARLAEIPGLRIIGTAARKSGVLSFVMDGIHPHDIGTVLDQAGVAIRTGQHCAQPVMDRYGIPATARISFGLYNTRADIDAAIPPLHDVRKLFG
jgi:cysteine desulfurase/selenocysteine lyase